MCSSLKGDGLNGLRSPRCSSGVAGKERKEARFSMMVEAAQYLKFTCPNCEKPIGFPAAQAGHPVPCPRCHVRIMIPERAGEVSFIVAASAPSPGRTPVDHARSSASEMRPNRSLMVQIREVFERTPWWRTALISASCSVVLVMAIVFISGRFKKEGETRTQALPAPPPRIEEPAIPADVDPTHQKKQEEPATEPVLTAVEPVSPNKSVPIIETTIVPTRKNTTESVVIGTRDGSGSIWSRPDPKELFNLDGEKRPSARAVEDEESIDEKAALTSTFPSNQPETEDPADEKQEDPVISLIKDKVRAEQAAEARRAPSAQTPGRKNDPHNAAGHRDVQPPLGPARVEAPVVCADCQGAAVRPLQRYTPYVWDYKNPAPAAMSAVPHVPCPKCQGKTDPKKLVARETARMRAAPGAAFQYAQRLNVRMECGETRYVSVLAQLSPTATRGVLRQLDKLTQFLQRNFRSALLTQTRPNTHRLVIAWDKANYERMIDVVAVNQSDRERELTKKGSGFISRHACVANVQGGAGAVPQHVAVFQLAHMLIREATGDKSPDWLTAGFASYCENKLLRMNICRVFRYELNQMQLGHNWNAAVALCARNGKLITWDRVFQIDLIGVNALEYLTCYSVVGYLASEPARFNTLLVNLRGGMDSRSALEHAYGRKIEDLQKTWARWAVRQR